MPKNAQGSWVGKTAAPVFKTYQTAGMLQPATTPTPPAAQTPSTPEAPANFGDVYSPGNLFGVGVGVPAVSPTLGAPVEAAATSYQVNDASPGRQRLVDALITSRSRGGSRGGQLIAF